MLRAIVFLIQEHPDEVVLQWWTGTVLHSYLFITLVAKLLRANVIIEFHEVLDTGEAKLAIARAYVRVIAPLIVNMANGFVIHSEFDRELLKNNYNLEKRLTALIPHGPYYQLQATSEKQKFQSTENSCYNLLFFGIIRPYKGLEDLIMAFNSLPKGVADKYRLTVVGETWEG